MPQSLLEAGQQALLIPRLQIDQPVRFKADLLERRGEQVGLGDAPQDRAGQSGRDAGGEQRRRRAVDRAVPAARHFVKGAERQPAQGQGGVHGRHAEGKDAGRAAAVRLEMLDPGAQGGELGGGPGGYGGLLSEV